jgi:hypothetical protein
MASLRCGAVSGAAAVESSQMQLQTSSWLLPQQKKSSLVDFRGGGKSVVITGCELLRSASVESLQSSVLHSQVQGRGRQKNHARAVLSNTSSPFIGKASQKGKPVSSSTPPQVVASPDSVVVAPPPPPSTLQADDAVPKPGEVPLPQELLHAMPASLQYEAGYLGGISEKTRNADNAAAGPSPTSYLTRILASKVYDVAIESPLELAPKLSEKIGAQIYLKREDMQPASTRFLDHLS